MNKRLNPQEIAKLQRVVKTLNGRKSGRDLLWAFFSQYQDQLKRIDLDRAMVKEYLLGDINQSLQEGDGAPPLSKGGCTFARKQPTHKLKQPIEHVSVFGKIRITRARFELAALQSAALQEDMAVEKFRSLVLESVRDLVLESGKPYRVGVPRGIAEALRVLIESPPGYVLGTCEYVKCGKLFVKRGRKRFCLPACRENHRDRKEEMRGRMRKYRARPDIHKWAAQESGAQKKRATEMKSARKVVSD